MSYWSEAPGHPVEDWQYEVANEDTRQGYWEWVRARIGCSECEPAQGYTIFCEQHYAELML